MISGEESLVFVDLTEERNTSQTLIHIPKGCRGRFAFSTFFDLIRDMQLNEFQFDEVYQERLFSRFHFQKAVNFHKKNQAEPRKYDFVASECLNGFHKMKLRRSAQRKYVHFKNSYS